MYQYIQHASPSAQGRGVCEVRLGRRRKSQRELLVRPLDLTFWACCVRSPVEIRSQPGFKDSQTLAKIHDKAATVPGSDNLCLHVSDRLSALFAVLSGHDADQWRLDIACYRNTADEFLNMLRQQNYYKFLLYRLATSQRVVSQVYQAHARLDVYYEVLGVVEDAHLASAWRANWYDDRARQELYFSDALGKTRKRN